MNKKALSFIMIFFFLSSTCISGKKPVLLDGDIIFQESQSLQGEELKLATKSRYTHMGIIFKKGKDSYVYEAVQPVKITPLRQFTSRGANGHFVIKRLKNRDEALTPDVIRKMKGIATGFLGKNYDSAFLWSDARIYCSELVWKVYKRAAHIEVGELQKLRDFDLTHPKVRQLMKKRYGASIPYNETVIAPVQMFRSEKLYTVQEEN